jgi:WD40 repeat protein
MIFIIIWFDIASEEIELNANPFNPFFMSDKTIKIWSIDGDDIYLMIILAGHTDIVTSVAFFPMEYIDITNNLKIRNLVIATSSLDETTKLWVVKNMSQGSEIKWTSACVETIKNENIVKSIAFRSVADPQRGIAYFLNSLNISRLNYSDLLDKFSVPINNSSNVRRFREFSESNTNRFRKVQPGGGLQNESRFFKLVSVNGKEVDGGRYELPSKTKFGKEQTRGPKNKASIAFSEICKKNNKKGECSYKFAIQETTRGSNKKVYNYEGKRVKLTKPIVLELNDKKVVIKYKNVITPIH